MDMRWSRVALPMGARFWGRGVDIPDGVILGHCLATHMLRRWPNVDIRRGLDMRDFYAFSHGELVSEIGRWIESRRTYIRRQY